MRGCCHTELFIQWVTVIILLSTKQSTEIGFVWQEMKFSALKRRKLNQIQSLAFYSNLLSLTTGTRYVKTLWIKANNNFQQYLYTKRNCSITANYTSYIMFFPQQIQYVVRLTKTKEYRLPWIFDINNILYRIIFSITNSLKSMKNLLPRIIWIISSLNSSNNFPQNGHIL